MSQLGVGSLISLLELIQVSTRLRDLLAPEIRNVPLDARLELPRREMAEIYEKLNELLKK